MALGSTSEAIKQLLKGELLHLPRMAPWGLISMAMVGNRKFLFGRLLSPGSPAFHLGSGKFDTSIVARVCGAFAAVAHTSQGSSIPVMTRNATGPYHLFH